MDEHEERLENEFNILNSFKTATRGLKVRGVYQTEEEANVTLRVTLYPQPKLNAEVARLAGAGCIAAATRLIAQSIVLEWASTCAMPMIILLRVSS